MNGWRTNEPWLPHNAYFFLALSDWDQKKPANTYKGVFNPNNYIYGYLSARAKAVR